MCPLRHPGRSPKRRQPAGSQTLRVLLLAGLFVCFLAPSFRRRGGNKLGRSHGQGDRAAAQRWDQSSAGAAAPKALALQRCPPRRNRCELSALLTGARILLKGPEQPHLGPPSTPLAHRPGTLFKLSPEDSALVWAMLQQCWSPAQQGPWVGRTQIQRVAS